MHLNNSSTKVVNYNENVISLKEKSDLFFGCKIDYNQF
jgi:hypothetical protein